MDSEKEKKSHHLSSDIAEVFSDNFFKEMERMAALIPEYNYISMVSLPEKVSVFMK